MFERLRPPELAREEPLLASYWWRFRRYPVYLFARENAAYPWHLDVPLWTEFKEGGAQQGWVPPDRYYRSMQHEQQHV